MFPKPALFSPVFSTSEMELVLTSPIRYGKTSGSRLLSMKGGLQIQVSLCCQNLCLVGLLPSVGQARAPLPSSLCPCWPLPTLRLSSFPPVIASICPACLPACSPFPWKCSRLPQGYKDFLGQPLRYMREGEGLYCCLNLGTHPPRSPFQVWCLDLERVTSECQRSSSKIPSCPFEVIVGPERGDAGLGMRWR